MNRKLAFRIILVIVVAIAIYRFYTNQPEYTLTHITGQTMGTIRYNVKYMGDDVPNYQMEIDSILAVFNQSLSTYLPTSEVSVLNRTGYLEKPSRMFLDVLSSSRTVYETSDGAFDPTVGPLVNAWGFGPDKKANVLDTGTVAALLKKTGFARVSFSEEKVRMDSSMYLDFSAIAKGYAVDLLAKFLESKGFQHYMVEIGGEVRARGQNEKNEAWTIGIEDPLVRMDEQKILAIVSLKDKSMATSGNYRNYYTVGDRVVAHTIDPRTGFNTSHNLLSASVFADDCMTADGYATAFMVLGLQGSKELVESSDLDAFLIYQDDHGALKTYVSKNLQEYVRLNRAE